MASDWGFRESNSYKRYKEGTNAIATWLADVASSCGVDIEKISKRSTPPSKKTKKQKKSPKVKKYSIPVRQFVELAQLIADSAKIVVPNSIYAALCEVISLRKEAKVVLGNFVEHEHGGTDGGHAHFITVLETVKEILRPLREKLSKSGRPEVSAKDVLVNKFDVLELEEPSPNIGEASSSTGQGEPASQNISSKRTYEFETSYDDVLVSTQFFFQDLNEIRALLRQLWTDYKNGRVDLSTASLVTNTAIELIQRNVKDQWALMSTFKDAPPQENFIWWTYCHVCYEVGLDFKYREKPEDRINFKAYDMADYCCWTTQLFIGEFLNGLESGRLTFVREPSRTFSHSKIPRERWDADYFFIDLLLSDLHNAQTVGLKLPPATDDITLAFLRDQISITKKMPMWLPFAVQIVTDIHHITQDENSRAFQELQTISQRFIDTARQHFNFARTIVEPREKWHKENDKKLLRLISFISECVKKDPINDGIRKYSKKDLEKEGIELPPHLMKHHPLLCGSIVYWLNMNIQLFGISLSNAYSSILSAAHLYNAAKQTNPQMPEWTDMAFFISVHTTNHIFVGDPPCKPEYFFKRFYLALGASITNYARNRRDGKQKTNTKVSGTDRKLRRIPIHDVFGKRYMALASRADLTNDKIDAVVREVVAKHLSTENKKMDHIAKYVDQWNRTRKLSSIQLLSILRVAIADEVLHLHFDYISMHIRCMTFLSNIREKFIAGANINQRALESTQASEPDETLVEYLEEDAMPEGCLASIIRSIFLANPEAAKVASPMDPLALLFTFILLQSANVSLARASEWMQEMIDKEGSVEVDKAGQFSMSQIPTI